MNQFNREVHELRSRASGISVDIGSASEMETLRKKTNLESKLCKAVVEATHVSHCQWIQSYLYNNNNNNIFI